MSDEHDRQSRRAVVASAVTVESGLAVVAILVGWLIGQPALAQVDWTLRGALFGLAGAVPMLVGLVAVTRFAIGPLAELERMMRHTILPLFRNCTLVDLLLISALAGLGEELLFRGVLQAAIERYTASPWLAVIAASALFGLAHPITRTYAVLAAVIGVYLGWLLLASGNLLVPIVTHGAYDFAALVYLLRQERTPAATAPSAEAAGDEWIP